MRARLQQSVNPYFPGVTVHPLEVARRLCRFARAGDFEAFAEVMQAHGVTLLAAELQTVFDGAMRGYTAELHRVLGVDVEQARRLLPLLDRLGDIGEELFEVSMNIAEIETAETLPPEVSELLEGTVGTADRIFAAIDGYYPAVGVTPPGARRGGNAALGGRGRVDLLAEAEVLAAKKQHGTRPGARAVKRATGTFKKRLADIDKRKRRGTPQ